MERNKVREITLIGLFSAFLAVLSQISIPMPTNVPLTLQTFAVALTGYMLGAKKGSLSVIIYIAIGAAGVPVFAGFKGGLGTVFGYTGGFIIGFILLAFLCGLGAKSNKPAAIALGIAGIAAAHLLGCLWFAFLTKNSFFASFLQVSAPYLIKDIISAAVAYFAALTLKKRIKFPQN